MTLEGLKIVFDGANGAGYKVGPRALANLDAEVIPIGCSPNGKNINDGCGSTEPELLSLTVPAVRADVGVALDGDGDRLVMVDENGTLIDGDQLLYVLATSRKEHGNLQGPVVGTVMSNLGLEHALEAREIEFRRAAVGDRYVLETLRDTGGVIGGGSEIPARDRHAVARAAVVELATVDEAPLGIEQEEVGRACCPVGLGHVL